MHIAQCPHKKCDTLNIIPYVSSPSHITIEIIGSFRVGVQSTKIDWVSPQISYDTLLSNMTYPDGVILT